MGHIHTESEQAEIVDDKLVYVGPRRWMRIESAPKDGRAVLLFDAFGNTFVGYWKSSESQWMDATLGEFPIAPADYWMPLPDPPNPQT